MRVSRLLPALAVALFLAGCGGGDDDSTTTGAGGEMTTRQQGGGEGGGTTPERNGARQGGGEKQGGAGAADKPASTVPFREPTGPAPTDAGSLPNEGERTATPGVPLAKGGDNSIQEFGVEGPSDDRVRAARVFQAYLNARLDGDWALACSYLSQSMKRQLASFGGQARGQGPPDCAQTMRAFTQGVPKAALRSAADINVLSMRVEGGQAFLLYRDGKNLPSSVPMNEEGGAWKVSAIAGSALFLGV
jgi:hypothetical protein